MFPRSIRKLYRYEAKKYTWMLVDDCEAIFMRIKKITVKKLFGMFCHEIPLNMDDHITIIHGPNGIGKTILLKMLNALFRSS